MHDAHLAADSLYPSPHQPTLYTRMIHVKLNTLTVSSPVYKYLAQCKELSLKPVHEFQCKRLVKSIVQQLADESVVVMDDRLREALGEDTPVSTSALEDVLADMEHFLVHELGIDTEDMKSRWMIRVAEYFCYCMEGGLIGELFTMTNLVEALKHHVSPQMRQNVLELIRFLLHWRSPDLSMPFKQQSLLEKLKLPGAEEAVFNNAMMIRMLEGGMARDQLDDQMYGKLIALLLTTPNASQMLRVTVCNILNAMDPVPSAMVEVVALALVSAIKTQGIYIATHCTSTLVKMCKRDDSLRETLVQTELPRLMLQNLKHRDDDLDEFTMQLFVVLCKSDHHRELLCNIGLVQPLVTILTSAYSIKHKRRLLIPLGSLIALVCNSEEVRSLLSEKYPTLECLQSPALPRQSSGLVLQNRRVAPYSTM
jgi:hypothetical protein